MPQESVAPQALGMPGSGGREFALQGVGSVPPRLPLEAFMSKRILFSLATAIVVAISAGAWSQDQGPRDCSAAAERLRAQCLAAGGTAEECQARVDEFLSRCERDPPDP